MHNPSISILGPGPDVMLIEGFDCRYKARLVANSNQGWVIQRHIYAPVARYEIVLLLAASNIYDWKVMQSTFSCSGLHPASWQ